METLSKRQFTKSGQRRPAPRCQERATCSCDDASPVGIIGAMAVRSKCGWPWSFAQLKPPQGSGRRQSTSNH